MGKEIRISPIRNGTAIDHLSAGCAYKIIEVLDLRNHPVTVGINVESRKMGRKDIIFIEGKEFTQKELDKVALIGHGATVNVIKNSEITKKFQLTYPEEVEGIMKCINPKCITNTERLPGKFTVKPSPLEAKCFYCETWMSEQDIVSSIRSD